MGNPELNQFLCELNDATLKHVSTAEAVRKGLEGDDKLTLEDREKVKVKHHIAHIKQYWSPEDVDHDPQKKEAVLNAIEYVAKVYKIPATEIYQWIFGEQSEELGLRSIQQGAAIESLIVKIAGTKNPALLQLIDPNSNVRFENIFAQLKRTSAPTPVAEVDVKFSKYENVAELGDKQCASYVSRVLGLDTNKEGYEMLVSVLLARLMKGIRKKIGLENVKLGFANFKPRDVIAWVQQNEILGHPTYSHIGIIRHTGIIIDGVEFLGIQHESRGIEITLVPVNVSNNGKIAKIKTQLKNPAKRELLIAGLDAESQRKLRDIYSYRAGKLATYVSVEQNAGFYGDASQNPNGKIVFGVDISPLEESASQIAQSQ